MAVRRGGRSIVRAVACGVNQGGAEQLDHDEDLRTDRAMESLSLSAARANLKAVMERVVADRAPVAITRPRKEGVVLIAAREWASIEETLYLLRSPANAKRLLESVRELEAGQGEERAPNEP
ncbi:type II toxin-antitoxin system prevent-host-death family antitoxin [Sphingomonas sp. RT2P30]|uniref:type II toxin-antitoxin system Phd/YefM family antitoxin n=1 Tax=Parasphingomonas halimpatiens TaxID=3096162 RepID=UPI002FCC65EB